MTIALEHKWIWDSWYIRDGKTWHAYFLQADKSLVDPDLRHFNATQGHATSTDLVNWTHHGTSFGPAEGPAWDDYTTWTGSVVKGDDGLWHLFYTGSCRAENGLKQRIGHATSRDLHHWERVGDGLALDIDHRYEELTPAHWPDRAMRDPWVMRDPSGEGWLMYFTARVPNVAEPNAGGAIGFATSPDLKVWTLQDPVFAGGLFGQMEVPQVFSAEGRWYCLFCTDVQHYSAGYAASYPGAPVRGMHYLVADDPRGPWQIAPGPFLDGDPALDRYAARILDTGDGLALMGFLHNPGGGSFVGEIADPAPVAIDADGWLRLDDPALAVPRTASFA
ncbi:levansucrase [Paracoccus fistulariae]|uniref:Levansucrase n=1 Tax=Paracoccus fistulariae TaxID=658446 RepID=A0ABY7SLA6_9RHOB|nr:levansucrase [Paracoccus fistulariae]MDB6182577.1 levansucrase [Paracoccus fistulariae]WCR07785.1 levansucrase [Paracoccus fistulariae]